MKRIFILSIFLFISLNLFSQENNLDSSVSSPEPTVSQENISSNEQTTQQADKNVVVEEGILFEQNNKKYASPDVKFSIKAEDEGSGVKAIYVMVDDSQFGIYESPLSFNEEGNHSIAYKIEDNVGNISPINVFEFILDKSAPNVILSLDKKPVKLGDILFINTNYNFSLLADDKYSGVKEIKYKVNDGEELNYTTEVNISGNAGSNYIKYYAIDNVGNVSETKLFNYFLDLTPPEVSIQIDPAPFVKDDNNYISDSTLIKISAKDKETLVEKIYYSINDSEFQEYKIPLKLNAGSNTIKAKAVDVLGNESEVVSISVIVDINSPKGDIIITK